MYDVAVVGGGPTGSYVACKLAGMGHSVILLERKQSIGEKVCCTGIIGQECVSSFEVREDVILKRVNSARLFSPSGSLLRLWREETQAYIVDRPAFDTALASRARGKGVEYLLDSPVTDIEFKGDRVRVKASTHGGETNFEAKAVIIASGFGSRLGGKLGLGRTGDFVIGTEAEVETAGISEIEVYFGQEVAPGFFAWLVPTSPHIARVGLLSRENPGGYFRKLVASLRAQGKILSSEVEPVYGGIPLKPPARTYGERRLAVGDAAGQVKPTTGGGIYYGLIGADIAATTLHQGLEEDDISAKQLARYEQEWKKRLRQELQIGYWARKLFERLNDRQIDRIFDIIKAHGIDEDLLKARDLSFDWHSKAILMLLGHDVLSKTIGMMRMPFRTRG